MSRPSTPFLFRQDVDARHKAGHDAEFAALNAADTKRQAEAGIKTIKLDGAVGKDYYDKAYAAGWEGIIKQSPQTGPKLKETFSKAK